ncbi:MAG: dTDP-4-dehydrorhamnose reductase [Saprospiraceae bacterium]|nr:dTDP-4-dehydrorhamnose reductase [Saprospiraceae bacterium]
MLKILVTGANGQLGNEIKTLSIKYPFVFHFTDIDELDITKRQQVDRYVSDNGINVIINCAAYNNVDKAETDKIAAKSLNETAVRYLAQISSKYNAFLFHISTDYVFGGNAHIPYKEDCPTFTDSYYAKTKLGGEEDVLEFAEQAIIIRTSWLYSSHGHNFVKTIMKYAKEKSELNVVYDQIGTPTYAADLAKVILDIIPNVIEKKGVEIYHYSNEGVASWYDFAKEIIDLSKLKCKLNPIETKDYPLPAKRPPYSIFNKTKIKEDYKIEIPYWKDSLKVCMKKLNQ